jgi:hypothetical protein
VKFTARKALEESLSGCHSYADTKHGLPSVNFSYGFPQFPLPHINFPQ